MARIEASHMEAAAKRWQDFCTVQAPSPAAEKVQEVRDRVKAGEKLYDVLREIRDQTPGDAMAAALRRMKGSLGLTRSAQKAFWEAMVEEVNAPLLSIEEAMDRAAMAGLVIGLTAQQLAEEDRLRAERQGEDEEPS